MKTPKRATNKRALVGIALGLICTVLALYISILLLSPRLPSIPYVSASPIDLNTKDDENDNRNRIQIEKIGVEVPFYTGNEDVLELGAWHRQPENGNPAQGGNLYWLLIGLKWATHLAKQEQNRHFIELTL